MKEQLISRGPDAEGSWCNDSQDVTLGHRDVYKRQDQGHA